ncbi:MAG: hypothetical protein QXD48_01250 [Candidatus Aenigmatarchaeota archaeon]
MDKKIVGIVFILIGLIALVGSGIFAWVLIEFSNTVSILTSADASTLSQYGIDMNQIQNIIQTVSTILVLGFLWIITVILSSLYMIKSGIQKFKKK